jgi:transcriptional regulator with XRE-family HTH domain
MLTRLRQLRKINDITLDQVAVDTGLSVGYLNRIERGYINDVKNAAKRKKLENYIKRLENKTRRELHKELNLNN